jgi:uncharacterized protein
MEIKPETQLKTLWYLSWVVAFCPIIILLLILFFFADKVIVGACTAAWLGIFIPILFWIPKAYRIVEYFIDDDSVKMQAGVVWKKNVTVPFMKITNIDITSGPIQRKFGVGTIHVQTAGYGGQQGQKSELKINGVKDTEKIRDIIIKNIKSYKISEDTDFKPAEILQERKDSDNSLILNNILNELVNIRKKLEK